MAVAMTVKAIGSQALKLKECAGEQPLFVVLIADSVVAEKGQNALAQSAMTELAYASASECLCLDCFPVSILLSPFHHAGFLAAADRREASMDKSAQPGAASQVSCPTATF